MKESMKHIFRAKSLRFSDLFILCTTYNLFDKDIIKQDLLRLIKSKTHERIYETYFPGPYA
jgi:hypothetical protein